MKQKICSILLVLCMILPSFGGLSALALDIIDMGDNATLISDNPYNKIHFYFDDPDNATIDDAAELQAATVSVKGDYAAALMAVDGESEVNENVYITVQFASDYMETNEYEVFKAALESATTPEMRDTVKTQRNTFSKSYHAAIIEENLPLLADIPYIEANAIDYSSFVTLTVAVTSLETAVLAEVVENESIMHISLSGKKEAVPTEEIYPSWNETLNCINAYDVVATDQTYTGSGLKIGVYEAGGVCDVTHVNLRDKNIVVKSSDSGTILEHATKVTSIIALMAPDADLYAANCNNSSVGLNWFIEQGCDIVNCSFAYYDNYTASDGAYVVGPRAYRYDIDAVYDQQIQAHSIIAVIAASNRSKSSNTNLNTYNPDNYMASPAHSYNAITVAGVEYSNDGWIVASRSCYKSNTAGRTPNIAAPYFVTIPNVGTSSGTSYATPLVAGGIALLMEANSECLGSPEFVLSILTATAQKTADYAASPNTNRHSDLKVGAGVLDLERVIAENSYINFVNMVNQPVNTNTNIIIREVFLEQGQSIQVGLAWLVTIHDYDNDSSTFEDREVGCTDYNLYLFDPSDENCTGIAPATSQLTNSNVEMLRYTATSGGMHTIIVNRSGQVRSQYDYITLTYDIVQ